MAVSDGPVNRLAAQSRCAVSAIHAYITQKAPTSPQRIGLGNFRAEERLRSTTKISHRCAITAATTIAIRFQNISRSTIGPRSEPSGGIHATCRAVSSRLSAEYIFNFLQCV